MDALKWFIQIIVGLVVILLLLSLVGISPYEVGQAVGDAFARLGTFFDGVQDS